MRRWRPAFCLASLAFLAGGCRMCAGPDDYTGPVIRQGLPTLGFNERHNSILSAGTYSSHVTDGGVQTDASQFDGEAFGDPEAVDAAGSFDATIGAPVIESPDADSEPRNRRPLNSNPAAGDNPPWDAAPPRSFPSGTTFEPNLTPAPLAPQRDLTPRLEPTPAPRSPTPTVAPPPKTTRASSGNQMSTWTPKRR